MRPTQHETNNDVLRPPPGMSNEECRPLAITRVHYEGTDLRGVWSFWEPSDAERAAIAAGAKVRFECHGMTHPPVYIGVDGVDY